MVGEFGGIEAFFAEEHVVHPIVFVFDGSVVFFFFSFFLTQDLYSATTSRAGVRRGG